MYDVRQADGGWRIHNAAGPLPMLYSQKAVADAICHNLNAVTYGGETVPITRECVYCGEPLVGRQAGTLYCDTTCKLASYREGKS
jgi:hypothetical protein